LKSAVKRRQRAVWIRRASLLLALLSVVAAVSGCRAFDFYGQAIKGQYQILARERPVTKLLASPKTAPQLKSKLQLLEELRAFAATELKLPVDNHYRKYADLGRPYVVWNVEAAPEFSLQPQTWWYPVVGRLSYRGYFEERDARRYAARLKRQGQDVSVGGVEAYSTLGWFKDPVLNTFIFNPEADLAETIFHELGHQRVFAAGDTDFNEAFATTVGQEGARRWLRRQRDSAELTNYLAELRRTRQFAHLVKDTRTKLKAIYGDQVTEDGKVKATKSKCAVPREELRLDKQRVLDDLRQSYAQLKSQWGGDTEYDAWFAGSLNNAKLNSVAAYYDLVPAFERLLKANGGDLEKFYQAAERLSKQPRRERDRKLREWGDGMVE
jgi:predicted aminopeptidase